MKHILSLIFIVCFIIQAYPQGAYVDENIVFNVLKKNDTAKAHGIRKIHSYRDYIDTLNKGELIKTEVYNAAGNLIEEIHFPNSKKEYQERKFVYDSVGNLIEIHRVLSHKKPHEQIFCMKYDASRRLTAMSWKYTTSDALDTLFYFYDDAGRFDYKFWGKRKSHKMYMRYNACGEIEYVESLPLNPESIRMDPNKCVIYSVVDEGDGREEKGYVVSTYNDACQLLTSYYIDHFMGKSWWIISSVNRYDDEGRLIQDASVRCYAKTKEKCLKNIRAYPVVRYEYNDRGLLKFQVKEDRQKELKSVLYTEYEFY